MGWEYVAMMSALVKTEATVNGYSDDDDYTGGTTECTLLLMGGGECGGCMVGSISMARGYGDVDGVAEEDLLDAGLYYLFPALGQ